MSKILLIDDDASLLDVLQEILEDAGFDVRAVDSGLSALQALHEETPDVVITDIWMLDMDGVELYHTTREKGIDVPFMFISAASSVPTERIKTALVGRNLYFSKPIRGSEFIEAVQSLLT